MKEALVSQKQYFSHSTILQHTDPVSHDLDILKFQHDSEALGTNCKFCIDSCPLSRKSQKRLEHKENQTKYRKMTRKPRSPVRVLIYRTWSIPALQLKQTTANVYAHTSISRRKSGSSWFSVAKIRRQVSFSELLKVTVTFPSLKDP